MGRRTAAEEARKMKSRWERQEEEVHCNGGEANRAVVVRQLKRNRVCREREVVGPTAPGKNTCGGHEALKKDEILGK